MSPRDINAEAEAITKALSDSGKLVEAGFEALRLLAMLPDAPPDQVREMRLAFFAGAQHLFGSIMTILDAGDDPTERDLRRMSLIAAELNEFAAQFSQQKFPTQPH